jgi:hypothetical protein
MIRFLRALIKYLWTNISVFLLFTLTILYSKSSTKYFGGNLYPESDAEMICDGIGCLLGALAIIGIVITSQHQEMLKILQTHKHPCSKND